jgi:DNA-binding beta-propeller fold protein YncE
MAGLIVALALFLAPGAASAQVSTTFDADLEGWTIVGDNTHFWNPTGGNPDGCLEVPDDASGPWSVAVAPSAYLGNWRDMTPSDSLSYDVLFLPTAGTTGNPPAVLRITGPHGSARFNMSIPDSQWVHISAPLDSSYWTVESGTWSQILRSVTKLDVAVEYRSGDETVRIDNVKLSGTPGAVDLYQACESWGFESVQAGWVGDGTASTSRVTSGGDIGAYLRVSSTTGIGRALLAPTFAGNWTPADGNATIGFSFTWLTGTIVAGRELRMALSGPGGSAHVSLPSDDFLDYARVWHPLSWPLEESAWTVDSGTWAGLLSDVQEVAISADLAVATDTYGIDNVFRFETGCAPVPVLPIAIHEAGYSLCGSEPFRNASAIALNPADGELYGLVSASTSISAGGGVYRLSGGPGRNVRMHTYSTPTGLVFTADGDGFVSEDVSGDLFRFVGVDSTMLWVDGGTGFHAGDDDIAGMTVAPPGFSGPNVSPGDLIVTDWGNGGPDEIWAVHPDTAGGERLLVPDPGSANFRDAAATAAGLVYVVDDVQDNALWVLNPDGSLTSLPLSATITNMRAIAYDDVGGAIYTLRTANPLGLYRVDPQTGQVTLIADGFGTFGDGNIEIDSANRLLYVADESDSRIYSICLPTNVAVDPIHPAEGIALAIRPNPARGALHVRFRLPAAAPVRVQVIDPAGRRVRTLAEAGLAAGDHAFTWDGTDASGSRLASGVYFIQVVGPGLRQTARAVLMQ